MRGYGCRLLNMYDKPLFLMQVYNWSDCLAYVRYVCNGNRQLALLHGVQFFVVVLVRRFHCVVIWMSVICLLFVKLMRDLGRQLENTWCINQFWYKIVRSANPPSQNVPTKTQEPQPNKPRGGFYLRRKQLTPCYHRVPVDQIGYSLCARRDVKLNK
jgi:hypothetical protein